MNVFQVYKKSVLEQIRDFKALLLTMMAPVIFIVIFGLAFGQGFYTYDVAVTNRDKGEMGQKLTQSLKESSYSNGNRVFVISEVTDPDNEIQEDLKGRRYHAHLYIPPDFSEKLQKADGAQQTELKITGDPAYSMYALTELTLENYLNAYLQEQSGAAGPAAINTHYINEAKVNSEFDAMAPGLVIIAVFFLLILSAMVLTREAENKTLQRLLLSKLKTWELFGGVTLSQMTIAVVMVPMAIASIFMLGFRGSGSIALTFFIGCLASLSAIGIGMIIAAFSRNGLDAFIIGNIVIVPLFFLSILPPPNFSTISLGGAEFSIFSLLPSLPATNAVNEVLLSNRGFFDVLPHLVLLVILNIVYWCLGVFLFNRRHVRKR